MSSRTPLIVANWKMNPPPSEWEKEWSAYAGIAGVDVVVCPMFPDMESCREKSLVIGAQCGSAEKCGARTGDVDMQSLAAHGCTYVLCGHSERRKFHQETDAEVAAQAAAARAAGLEPIVCVGETADERDQKKTGAVIERQVRAVTVPAVFAYEPVWAIGSGTAASPESAQEVQSMIRGFLDAGTREEVRILYGGSVKPENTRAFLEQPDVDGLLVGAASLNPASFRAIVEMAKLH